MSWGGRSDKDGERERRSKKDCWSTRLVDKNSVLRITQDVLFGVGGREEERQRGQKKAG